MSNIEITFVILGAIGSLLSGIIMLITFLRVITKLSLKEEVIYGNEAISQYKKIENKLNNSYKIRESEYEGGSTKIIPRLEVQKCNYNPILMEKELKKYKQRVRYFYIENEKRYVKTWYIK